MTDWLEEIKRRTDTRWGDRQRLIAEVERLRELAESDDAHGQPCHYCGERINCLAANPNKWGIPLCHADAPGVVKWHHIGCVSERLEENEKLRRENAKLLKAILDGV